MAKQNKTPEALRPFEFHGIEFSVNGTQAQGDCFLCSSPKFFIDKKTGQYSCKSCGAEGNKSTFLTQYHNDRVQDVTQKDLAKISKLRDGVFTEALIQRSGLCFDDSGNVLFPVKSPGKKNLSNLRKWCPSNGVFYNTPSCCSMFYVQWYDVGPIYICEGEWDALALKALMMRAKYSEECSIVAVPGANTFKDSWIPQFHNREVVLLYDNDHDKKRKNGDVFNPGRDGMEMVSKKLDKVSSIRCIDWDNVKSPYRDRIVTKDGYDICDYLIDAKKSKKSKNALRNLLKATKTSEGKVSGKLTIKALKRTEFSQVVKDFKDNLEFNQTFEDVLAACFASVVTLYMPHQKKNPLWMFIVAPPSSGKTTIIEAFDAASQSVQVSNLTPASLASGLKDEESCLLDEIRDKVLFVKDFTPILSGIDKERVFGILRDSYDGSYVARFATRNREFTDLYYGLVAGVTHAIERESMTELGERFLRIRLVDNGFDEQAHILKALENVDTPEKKSHKELFQASVLGFIEHLLKNIYQPTWEPGMNERLASLAQLVAILRTSVPRSNGRELSYRPVSEVASRVATQLKKLGLGLALVYSRKSVDNACYRVMQKVAFDSCVGWKFEIIQTLDRLKDGLTVSTIAHSASLSTNQVRKVLEDCLALGIVEFSKVSNGSGQRGRKSNCYKISSLIRSLMKGAGVSFKIEEKRKVVSNKTKRSKKKPYRKGSKKKPYRSRFNKLNNLKQE